MSSRPTPPPKEAKDWTWVLGEGCSDCGFDPAAVPDDGLPARLEQAAQGWAEVLTEPGRAGSGRRGREAARQRPDPQTWAPLEYACHVRDVCTLMRRRLNRMLTEDDPEFADWDQDEAAVAEDYLGQDPGWVADELEEECAALAAAYAEVTGSQWDRPGRRGDGHRFTVRTLGHYALHELEHHRWDVGAAPS